MGRISKVMFLLGTMSLIIVGVGAVLMSLPVIATLAFGGSLLCIVLDKANRALYVTIFEILSIQLFLLLPALVGIPSYVAVFIFVLLDQYLYSTITWRYRWIFSSLRNLFSRNQEFLALVDKVKCNNSPNSERNNTDDDEIMTVLEYNGFGHRFIGNGYLRMLADALKSNSTIVEITLFYHVFDSHGLKDLCRVLSLHDTNTTAVTTLGLSWNRLGDSGAKVLAQLLQSNTSLLNLNLRETHIGTIGVEALGHALVNNETLLTLILDGNRIKHVHGLAEGLKQNRSLQSLSLRTTSFTSFFCPSHIGASGIEALAEALEYNQGLHNLILDGNKIRNLHVLAEGLKKNTFLKKLSLSNMSLSSMLSDMALVRLCICHHVGNAKGMDSLFQALEENQTIEELNVSGNKIQNLDALAAALTKNTSLKTLWLANNCFGDAGIEILAGAMQEGNVSLKRLFLGLNRIGARGVRALVPVLSRLTYLSLPYNGFGDEGGCVLADALTTTTGDLQMLDIMSCSLTEDGGKALEAMLRVNDRLGMRIRGSNWLASMSSGSRSNKFSAALDSQILQHLRRNHEASMVNPSSLEDGDDTLDENPRVNGLLSRGALGGGVMSSNVEYTSISLGDEAEIGVPLS